MTDAKARDEQDSTELTADEARLLEGASFVFAGRPDRIDDAALSIAPPEHRAAVREARDILSFLARTEVPQAAPPDVRAKVLESFTKKATKRALVIIDMIKDHLSEGTVLEVPRARVVIPALQKRIKDARASGVPIVYVIDEHEHDDSDLDSWGTHAVKGSVGTEVWDEIAPESGDHIVKKPSFSAFYESNLAEVLGELKVDTLVLAGCLTEIGIMATATDAMQKGYAVEVPPDTQAGTCVELETAAMGTLAIMAPYGPARKKLLAEVARAA